MGPDAMTKKPVSFDTMMKLWWKAQTGENIVRSYTFTYDGQTADLRRRINKHFNVTPCRDGILITYKGIEVVIELDGSRKVRITEQY